MKVFTTGGGWVIQIKPISRTLIDDLNAANPPPVVPKKEVELMADLLGGVGVIEFQPDETDPAYQVKLVAHYHQVKAAYYSGIISKACKIVDAPIGMQAAMRSAKELAAVIFKGAADDEKVLQALWMQIILDNDQDYLNLIGEIKFQSTVTMKGIDFWGDVFAAEWMGKKIEDYYPPSLPATHSDFYRDLTVSAAYGYKWPEFCAMSGLEQSKIIAHWIVKSRMAWLEDRWQRQKNK